MVRSWYTAVRAAVSEPAGQHPAAAWTSHQLGVTSPTALAAGDRGFSHPADPAQPSEASQSSSLSSLRALHEVQLQDDLAFLSWAESSGGRAMVASELRALRTRAASRSVSQVRL